jgi:hypothetical protein
VEIDINAKPDVVWRILTNAEGFPHWNSTVSGIDGQIREGERIQIHAPGTTRTFKPKVKDVVTNSHMKWSDGLPLIFNGSRTFELRPSSEGSTDFVMQEEFSGLLFALVKRSLPDFKPIFESYANDLKKEAERTAA